MPGVYHSGFSARAIDKNTGKLPEERRRKLECDMLSHFRIAGASLLATDDEVEIYFLAQHFGMPTRLLDWSTNPLAALFFACDGENVEADGYVYAMQAGMVIPKDAQRVTDRGGAKTKQPENANEHAPFACKVRGRPIVLAEAKT